MVLHKIHSDTPYASRAGEFYRRQRDNKELLYPCPSCAAAFYIKSQLRNHQLQHTGENPFACDMCNYAAKQKILLDKHRERCHNIPLPSTRLSRYKKRTSLPAKYACRRIVKYTGKVPNHKNGRLMKRVKGYGKGEDILSMINNNLITKKDFYADKSAGYISDNWVIYPLKFPNRIVPIGNSQRKTEKMVSFMNQISNIFVLFPSINGQREQLAYLKKDNKTKQELIDTSLILFHNLYQKVTPI